MIILKLTNRQLRHCLPIGLNLLGNQPLLSRTLIHHLISVRQLLFQLLLCNAHIIQAFGQEIQVLQQIPPTLFFDQLFVRHVVE